jgi:hypothetical protein
MLLETRNLRGGSYAADPSFAPQTSLSDVFNADYDANRYSWLTNSAQRASEATYDARSERVKAKFGVDLPNPWRAEGFPLIVPTPGVFGIPSLSITSSEALRGNTWQAYNKRLEELAEQNPDDRDWLLAPIGKEAVALQRSSSDRAEDVFARGPTGSWGARLAAGLVSSFEDPVNVMALAAGPWNTVGRGAKAVLWNGVKTGAINAAAEVGSYSAIKEWRQKAGLEYTPEQLAEHAGIAFAFGFGLDAGVRGGYRAGKTLFKGSDLPKAPDLTAGGQKPAPLAPPPADASAALETAARGLPESNPVRRAANGDRAALDELVTAAGLDADPAIRGAKLADDADEMSRQAFAEADRALSLAKRLREDDEAGLAQATRHALDDSEPPPGHVDTIPEARGPDLSDEAPLPKGRKNQYGTTFQVDGKKVRFREVDPKKLTVDPDAFQIKTGAPRLTGVTSWDADAAGRAVVFEKKSGEMVVADGHARKALADRLPDAGNLPAYVMREADGWTAADVRAHAAKKNLQEGSVGTIDAARVMRETPGVVDASIPLATEAMRQARSLARLSDEAFAQVEAGHVPAKIAAMIGDLVPDQSRHAGLIADLAAAEPRSAAEARRMLGELMREPGSGDYQRTILMGRDLFSLPVDPDTPRALRLRDYVRAAYRAARYPLAESALKPEVAAQFNEVLGRLRRGKSEEQSLRAELHTMENIEKHGDDLVGINDTDPLTPAERGYFNALSVQERRSLLQAVDGGRAEPETLRANGFDEPNGPEAKAQVEALEAQFKKQIADAKQAAKGEADEQPALLSLFDASTYTHAPKLTSAIPQVFREIDEVASRLPAGVRLRVADALTFNGTDINGRWNAYDAIIHVALSAKDAGRTARHEEVHALKALGLMTEDEFDTLYARATRLGNNLRKQYKIDERYGALYKKQFGDQAEAFLREETIAEMIADYGRGKRFGDDQFVNELLDRIIKFLSDVQKALTGYGFTNPRDVFKAIESGEMAARPKPRPVAMPSGAEVDGVQLFALRAFHGSPHDFDRFDSAHIGRGEGAQAYGHGLYFAESADVAKAYKASTSDPPSWRVNGEPFDFDNPVHQAAERLDVLGGDRAQLIRTIERHIAELKTVGSKARPVYQKTVDLLKSGAEIPPIERGGKVYEVRLNAEPEQFLDWDKPLSQQSEEVRKLLAQPEVDQELRRTSKTYSEDEFTGSYLYTVIGLTDQTTARLTDAGLVGIRYLDGQSRDGSGGGTSNYVIFPGNEHLIEIVAKDGMPVDSLKANLDDASRTGAIGIMAKGCNL